ncbi:MAG TPA: cobyrinate a,c-diamide synthase [Dehalococcoidia bacterium]|nr:cobyrinate a,c-diamide synthase [Dehalococcoidia bacterium]
MARTIVVAGVHSGVGKTTIATGLMAAFTRRGLRVQGFKVGPDYIDPSYHTAVTGRPSRNLDTWMLPHAAAIELFQRASRDADLCIVEGVMGLFDGRTGGRGAGSTAEVAALLGLPVLLVVDGWKIARSAAAIVHGYRSFDPRVELAGVVLNRIAGEGHYRAVAPPIEEEAGVPVVGSLGRDERLALPERYLGLIPTTEGPIARSYVDALAELICRQLDLERILKLACEPRPAVTVDAPLFPVEPLPKRVRLALARDRAFSFYYQDALDLLAAHGADLVAFSPMEDAALPAGTDAVYLGGGFPELFAAQLAANRSMLKSLRDAARRGMPIYGECGGYMYLGESLTDADGERYEMVGLLPLASTLSQSRITLGYRELRALKPGPVGPAGTRLRGHEFHWSVSAELAAEDAVYAAAVDGGGERLAGGARGSVWGSYMHLHFGSDPALAPAFVRWCQTAKTAGSPPSGNLAPAG